MRRSLDRLLRKGCDNLGVLENRDLWVQIAELIATIAQGGGGGSGVTDVKVAGTSVVTDGVANIPLASTDNVGVVKLNTTRGIDISSDGALQIHSASISQIKASNGTYAPIVAGAQHSSTFYGLAKASGDETQSASSNAVGTYTDDAKQSIKEMLGITCFIPVTYDNVEDAYTSDFSYADIVSLIDKGCYCIVVESGLYYPLQGGVNPIDNTVSFTAIDVDATNGVTSNIITFSASGITYSYTTYPAPTNP